MNKANQISVVLQFNEYINSQDLDGLSSLMTDDHTLTTGSPILGKQKVLKAWEESFVIGLVAADRKIDLKKLAKIVETKRLRLASAKEVLKN